MCGIAGIFSKNFNHLNSIHKLIGEIRHRGPDAEEIIIDKESSFAFAHTRLAIIDLSQGANQPMFSKCKNFCIIFNGEIYNYLELRKKLNQYQIQWRTNSDTEVLLQSIIFLGLERTLATINGMFAFAFVDKRNQVAFVCRDYSGEKPLYYGNNNGAFVFSSSLNSFKKISIFKTEINHDSLAAYLNLGYVPSPLSIYDGVSKLESGCYLRIDLKSQKVSSPISYKSSINDKYDFDYSSTESILRHFDSELEKSIKLRLRSDVPVGLMLSGGLDSSLIASKASIVSSNQISGFTIGSEDIHHNEIGQAKKIAEYLGLEHHSLILSDREIQTLVPLMSNIYDEPFSDSSQISTTAVSQFISSYGIKVCLTGDAGDELFCGYNRYNSGLRAWKNLRKIKPFSNIFLNHVGFIYKLLEKFDLSGIVRTPNMLSKIQKLKRLRNISTLSEYYSNIIKIDDFAYKYINKEITFEPSKDVELAIESTKDMMLMDFYGYMQDDILCKVDRASMFFGVESRSPFLDPGLISLSFNMPEKRVCNQIKDKILIRKLLANSLPESLISKQKRGFSVPIDLWLRSDLRDWAENLLQEDSISKTGLLNFEEVEKIWKNFLKGKVLSDRIWNLLMLQDWALKNANE